MSDNLSDSNMNHITFEMPKNRSNSIKVIGVGGGGSNAVEYMYQQDIKGVDFVICNTDAQALDNSSIPNKVQLGALLTEGMGAGANPEIGAKAAKESYEKLTSLLDTNTKMVFITAGMGGGTGTGAAPIIAEIAKGMGLLTVGIVTLPFEFEGRKRNNEAQKGITKLREQVDSLIVINNNKLREVYGDLGYKSGFAKADEVLSTAARGIAEVITHHYKQNIDLNDAKTVLSNSGTAIMGSEKATGEDRAQKAITGALDSPLLNDNKITGAKNVLLLIVSGTNEITLGEIGNINDYIRSEAGHDVNIILGIGDDEQLGEGISITIIATGFSVGQQHEILDTEMKRVVHVLDDDQPFQFDLFKQEEKNTVTPFDDEKNSQEEIIFHKLDEGDIDEITPTTNHILNIEVGNFEEIARVSKQKKKINSEKFLIENEDDFSDLIITPEFINELEVIYDEVLAPSFDSFSPLNEEKDTINESNEENDISFDFTINDYEEITAKEEVLEIENDKVQFERQEEPITTFNLSDFDDEKCNLESDSTVVEEEISGGMQLKLKIQTEEKVEVKEEIKSNLGGNDVATKETISPLNASIAEFKKTADSRRTSLKSHNYNFHKNPSDIEELEKEPAYKRQQIELNENVYSNDDIQSRTTIEIDENNEMQVRTNNSFLDDNVD